MDNEWYGEVPAGEKLVGYILPCFRGSQAGHTCSFLQQLDNYGLTGLWYSLTECVASYCTLNPYCRVLYESPVARVIAGRIRGSKALLMKVTCFSRRGVRCFTKS